MPSYGAGVIVLVADVFDQQGANVKNRPIVLIDNFIEGEESVVVCNWVIDVRKYVIIKRVTTPPPKGGRLLGTPRRRG